MLSFSTNRASYTYKKASFLKRLAAFYLAATFIIFLSYLFSYLISIIGDIELYSRGFWTLFLWVLFIAFITDEFFQCFLTFNLAKYVLGLRVVDEREFKSIGFVRAVIRTILAFISFILGGLGFVAILFNREKLSMHDMFVRSTVVDLNENIISKSISAITAFCIAIPGLIVTLGFVVILLTSPLFVWSSVKDYQYQKTIEVSEWFDNPKAQYSISLDDKDGSKYVTFLITDTGTYYDNFSVQANQKDSTINVYELDLFDNMQRIKFDLSRFLDTRDFLSSFYLKAEKIVFKTLANYDLSVRNPKFFFDYKNIIADDILSSFKYNIVEQENRLKISLSDNLTAILRNTKLSYLMKSQYVSAVYHIEEQWMKFLYALDVKEKAELMAVKTPLANNVRILVDPQTGYIQEYNIIHPGKNTLFNRVTNRFLNSLQFKAFDPSDLSPSDTKNNSLDITLLYRELI